MPFYKKIVSIAFVVIFMQIMHTNASAMYDPLTVVNNRFGMHIVNENDLEDTARLVNSGGGDWGYVKLVIQEDDRKIEKWQAVFDKMRKLHLVPIVRMATRPYQSAWVKPRVEDIGSWVDFLNSLNWVTENRYVVIFNEPNHAAEWGNEVNPEEYGWYLKEFSRRLKEKSPDFFILPAGLDASAPNSADTMDETKFLEQMVAKEPDVFSFIDGWSSHSYPNPGFVGSPAAFGRGSVRTFEWEQELLKTYHVKNLPIFILETGWSHSEGKRPERTLPSAEITADYYRYAFENVWNNPRIAAVTPFIFNYQDAPFDHFSWRQIDSNKFYPVYEAVQTLPKVRGAPKQRDTATILSSYFPVKVVTNSHYTFFVDLENTGQSIMSGYDGWKLTLNGLPKEYEVQINTIKTTEPFHRTRVEISFSTDDQLRKYPYTFVLEKNGQTIDQLEASLTIVPPPSILIQAKVWFNQPAEGSDFSVLIYDKDQRLLYEADNVLFSQGYADVENLYNTFPNGNYRLVLKKPFYLPRQVLVTLSENKTGVPFPPLLPLDPSNDGKIDVADVGAFIAHPLLTLQRWLAL